MLLSTTPVHSEDVASFVKVLQHVFNHNAYAVACANNPVWLAPGLILSFKSSATMLFISHSGRL